MRPGGAPPATARRQAELLLAFTRRNLRTRYKQSLLGPAWAVIQPLTFLVLFVVFLGHAGHLGSGSGLKYPAFVLSSLVPWQFVSSGVNNGGNALVTEAVILRKVPIPHAIPVLAGIAAVIPDLVIGLVLLVALGPVLGTHFSLTLAWVPVLCLGLAIPVAAISLPVAALMAYYRDLRHGLPVAMQLWLFASPVAYPISTVPSHWRSLYAAVNPVAGPIDGFRRVAAGHAPDPGLLAWSLLGSAVILLAGGLIFRVLQTDLADVV